jgi:GTP-binding protein YchF
MRAGLAGYARSGKTTLFNALTGLNRGHEAKMHLGAIKVPDARIDKLSAMFKPRKTTPAEVLLADLPGPRAKGASLETEALQALREVDALCLVLRAFAGEAPPDPVRDLRDFDAELILSDLQVAEKRLHRLRQERNTGGEFQELSRLAKHLESGAPLRLLSFSDAEDQVLAHFAFLSRKPLLVVVNVPEETASQPVDAALEQAARSLGAETIALSAEVESEIAQLAPAEQPEYLASLGLTEPARARFLHAVYALLHQISFFTVGEDEVRAWTIKKGDRAARAAGKIHSDLEKSFVRAEVMHYDDFIAAGTEHRARELGKLRLEGKDYLVHDGDILTVRAGRAK